MRIQTAIIIVGWTSASLMLSSCSQFEPFQRAGTWHETGAPMQNIQAELVNPTDFYHGHGETLMTGIIAEHAIRSGLHSLSASGSATGSSSAGSGLSAGVSGASTGGMP